MPSGKKGKDSKMSASNTGDFFIGVDDGHYAIKIVAETGETFSVPSRGAIGKHLITLKGEDEGIFYDTEEGQTFTVSEFLPRFEDTRFLEYPRSQLNRVLVHDALRRAGYGGRNVRITTGLPVSYYYMPNGEKNQALIDSKVANLRKLVKCGDLPLAKIIENTVTTEAVASFVDQLMDIDGSPSDDYEELTQVPVGVIDVGGKTTDCAVLLPGMMVDSSRSGSNDVGVLMLVEAVSAKLRAHLDLDTALPTSAIERALRTGTVKIYGKEQSVKEIVDEEKERLADQIMSAVRTKVGSGVDLDHVLFVGGGAIVLREQLLKHYPHARVPEQPEFANARGMLKFAKHVVGGA